MSKKTLFALLLLLPCVCRAGEDSPYPSGFVEQGFGSNFRATLYNIRTGLTIAAMYNKEKNDRFSYDPIYFRIIEDDNTWRFYTNFYPFLLSFFGMFSGGEGRHTSLFFPGLSWGALILTSPSILMNPTLRFQATRLFIIGVGYNTDFFILTPFVPRSEIYFAPKIQLGLVIANDFLLSMVLSYQVVDCFATKRGFHLGLSLIAGDIL